VTPQASSQVAHLLEIGTARSLGGMLAKDAPNRRKRRLVHPWNRLELGIHASLHFCKHSPEAARYQGMGIGTSLRDAAQQGCCDTAHRARAYMDVWVRRIGTVLPQRSLNVYAVGQVLQTWC